MSVVIDGAVPRTDAERVAKLLDEADILMNIMYKKSSWREFNTELYKEYWRLNDEYRHAYQKEDYEHWYELENDVIDLINDLLPDDVVCVLHPDDPGTVVIWDVSDDE
jgi:hypothetical protein